MKRPSFQFYPGDWRSNAKLRRCSEAARGAWMDVLCVLHDAEEYGVCRWPLVDLARAAGVPIKLVRELADKDVLKGSDRGAAPYVFAPSHAGKLGEPVTLVEPGDGPCWYSSRFVRDEWVRQRRGGSTRFDHDNQPPKATPVIPPKPTPNPTIGARQGDGPSSSSSSSASLKEKSPPASRVPPADAGGRATRKCPPSFQVTAELRMWAAEEAPHADIDAETSALRDHTFKNAISDWAGAWRNWMRRANKDAAAKPARHVNGHAQHRNGTSYADRKDAEALNAAYLIGAIRRPAPVTDTIDHEDDPHAPRRLTS